MSKKKRMSAAKKEALVLRLLHGEDIESVSRESGIALHLLNEWREAYTRAGREGLKKRPGNPVQTDLQRIITQQALEIEILKKAKALVDGRKL
jgi:transposase